MTVSPKVGWTGGLFLSPPAVLGLLALLAEIEGAALLFGHLLALLAGNLLALLPGNLLALLDRLLATGLLRDLENNVKT